MNLLSTLQSHPLLYLTLFLLVVGTGLPLPATPALLIVGALAASGKASLPIAIVLAPLALLPGDLLWYALGRRFGHRVVTTLCKLSLERDACIQKTQLTFSRFKLRAFIAGRYVPGFSIVAPPIAGATGQPLVPLLTYNFLGTFLFTTPLLVLGYLFAAQLDTLISKVGAAGKNLTLILVLLLAIYIVYKLLARYWLVVQAHVSGIAPLAAHRLVAQRPDLQFIDLRSPGDLTQFPFVIPFARRRSEDQLLAELEPLPRHTPIVLFCYCPNQETSTKLARTLRRKGFKSAWSLRGGIHAWKSAGLPLNEHTSQPTTA